MMGLDPSKLSYLAMNYDPTPILQSLQVGASDGGGLKSGTDTAGFGSNFSNFLNPDNGKMGTGSPAGPNMSSFMDPKTMMGLAGQMNSPAAQLHFMGGTPPSKAPPLNLKAIEATPPGGSGVGVNIPSLGALLAGSPYKR